MTKVKICGITDAAAMNAASDGGAQFAGLVFYPPSPRYVSLSTAKTLSDNATTNLSLVGLFVDPEDSEIAAALDAGIRLDMIQLHGKESPERITDIRKTFGLPVMKAVRIAVRNDLADIKTYQDAADWLLFDTKETALPGGTGKSFNWNLLQDFRSKKPWMLAGGLNSENIGQALSVLSPNAVDVSSGVETVPGHKDPARIKAFLYAVQKADS